MAPDHTFTFDVPEGVASDQTLLVGLSHVGMASLTTVDHIARTQEAEHIGRIAPKELPAITPFEDGVPRHHTRFYDLDDTDVIVLVGELFVPTPAAGSFATALGEWMESQAVAEVGILHGIPFPHGPEEHTVFHVATPDYRDRHDDAIPVPPMKGGYLDGVTAELVSRSLDGAAPPTGVFITPTHPPGPDVESALRFLDIVEQMYDLTVDREQLEQLSSEIEKYYTNLAERMAVLQEQERPGMSTDLRDDRMFM